MSRPFAPERISEMTAYLFICVVTAGVAVSGYSPQWKSAWNNAGTFHNGEACHKAASNLGLKNTEYRCIAPYTGEQQKLGRG